MLYLSKSKYCSLWQCPYPINIHKVASFEKKIPLEWINTDYTDMLPIFHQYARPLIQAELTPIYINGLPRHIYLKEEKH